MICILGSSYLILNDYFQDTLNLNYMTDNFDNVIVFGIFFFLVLSADIFLPIPSTIVINEMVHILGFGLTALIATLGLLTANIIGYYSVRLGLKALPNLTPKVSINLESHLYWVIVGTRFIPILPELIALFAGFQKVPFYKFLIASLLGIIPFVTYFCTIAISFDSRLYEWLAIIISMIFTSIIYLIFFKNSKEVI